MAEKTDIEVLLNTLVDLMARGRQREAEALLPRYPGSSRALLARIVLAGGACTDAALLLLAVLARDDDCNVRAQAVESLMRHSGRFPDVAICDLMKNQETEPWVQVLRARLCNRIARSHLDAALHTLRFMACVPQQWIQREVQACLATCWGISDKATWQTVAPWLNDQNEYVRETAIRFIAMGRHPNGSTVPSLLHALAYDRSALVREGCARVLSSYAVEDLESALPQLIHLSRDRTHWFVRLTVARGLVHWRQAAPYEALATIKPLLSDPVDVVRKSALRQLRKLTKSYPALAFDVVTAWHDAREVQDETIAVCLEEISCASAEPTA